MKTDRREALTSRIEKLTEQGLVALEAAGNALAERYYKGIDELRSNGAIEGYVKLHFRARMRDGSLELAWVNKHVSGGKRGYESIPKPRGKPDYNMSVLKNQGVEGMSQLIEEIEEQARLLRQAHRKLIEGKTAFEVMTNRLAALSPKLIRAITNAGQEAAPKPDTQHELELEIL